MQFSQFGADFEGLSDTCHYQYSSIFLHVPEISGREPEILDLPNPHDETISVLRTPGTRSVGKLTLKNLMLDLNDMAASIEYRNDSYTLGSENFTFAGIYPDHGLFCKGKTCYFGIAGNYSVESIIDGFECKSTDQTVSNEVINSAVDCAAVCGHKKGCKLFSYNPNTNVCKLEKSNTEECLEGWTPSDFSSFKPIYNLEKEMPLVRKCTSIFGKTCMDYIEIVDINGKVIKLGDENKKFKDPEQDKLKEVKGVYHRKFGDEVTYYVGERASKNCFEDPKIKCGIDRDTTKKTVKTKKMREMEKKVMDEIKTAKSY